MKYVRTTKCYFSKWLTTSKKQKVAEFLQEMCRVVNWCIENYDILIIEGMKKYELILAENLSRCDSWLTARAKKNAFMEAYGLVIGNFRSSKALNNPYSRPKHSGCGVYLSENNVSINGRTEITFDLLCEIYCFDSRKKNIKIAIPLKKHRHFNKLVEKGKLAKTVLFNKNYIQFCFEFDVSKKQEGDIIGIDPGAKNLLTDDRGNHYGTGIWELLTKLKRKKRCSNAWYRCREEIIEYIDKTCKSLSYNDLRLLVLEDNRKIKNKSKLKGRLSKNMRSVLAGWSINRINSRIEQLCEENGVSFRKVPAYYNSITCPSCGHCEKANRQSQEEFICRSCGSIYNADVVGAMNSLGRFALGTYGSEFKHSFLDKYPIYLRVYERF